MKSTLFSERATKHANYSRPRSDLDDQNVDTLIHFSIVDSSEVITVISNDPVGQIRPSPRRGYLRR